MNNLRNEGITTLLVSARMIILPVAGIAAGYYVGMSHAPKSETNRGNSAWRTASVKLSGALGCCKIGRKWFLFFFCLSVPVWTRLTGKS